MSGSNLTLHVAALTHLGRHRYVNEDCIAVGPWITQEPALEPRLLTVSLDVPCACLVADGMGGHPAGDVASRIAVDELTQTLPGAFGNEAALRKALVDANAAVFHEQGRHPEYRGMGTTIAGILVGASQAYVLHAGDSRVYRIEQDRLIQLTQDDTATMVVRVFGMNMPSRSLVQCLGGYSGTDPLDPHVQAERVAPDTCWLVCSDGLHDMLDLEEMQACLCGEPEAVVEDLFNRAMDAGGRDNISIIAARVITGS